MTTIHRIFNEYTRIETSVYEGRVYYDCYEVSGLMKYMRGYDQAVATFGQFEVAYDENTGKKVVRWTVYLGTDAERDESMGWWVDCHESSNGEYLDDLNLLRAGQVEYIG